MPTIFRTRQGWAVRIYPNDHRPPHVHVVAPEWEARFELLCDAGSVRLMDNYGFSRSHLNDIAKQLIEQIPLLCDTWREWHG